VDRCFLEFQGRMIEAYNRYLPPDRTLRLDAQQPPATLAENTFEIVHNTASLDALCSPSRSRNLR
jgi:hypothetical protein